MQMLLLGFLVLAILALTHAQTLSDNGGFGSPQPIVLPASVTPREGTVYGNNGNLMFVAGGVNTRLTPTNALFTDVLAFDMKTGNTNKVANLPGPSYFGCGGWWSIMNSLVVIQGRNNSNSNGGANTYFSDAYIVSFPTTSSPTLQSAPTSIKTLPLSPLTPRAYASSVIINDLVYMFGGITGPFGNTTLSTNETFVSINVRTGAIQNLACDTNCSSKYPVRPVVYTESTNSYVYVYGGLSFDRQNFNSNDLVYVYSIAMNSWLSPLSPTQKYPATSPRITPPRFVFNAWSMTSDWNRVILIGGDVGSTSGNIKGGSQNLLYVIYTNSATVQLIPQQLSTNLESSAVGVNADGSVFAFSGATYSDAQSLTANSYVNNSFVLPLYVAPTTPPPTPIPTDPAAGSTIAWMLGLGTFFFILFFLWRTCRNDQAQQRDESLRHVDPVAVDPYPNMAVDDGNQQQFDAYEVNQDQYIEQNLDDGTQMP